MAGLVDLVDHKVNKVEGEEILVSDEIVRDRCICIIRVSIVACNVTVGYTQNFQDPVVLSIYIVGWPWRAPLGLVGYNKL